MKFLTAIASVLAIAILGGCAGQTATEQIKSQTGDPIAIMKAAYIDASDIYINAASSYAPYRKILEKSNPDLAAKIKEQFIRANAILDEWRQNILLNIIYAPEDATLKELRMMVINAIAEMEAKR